MCERSVSRTQTEGSGPNHITSHHSLDKRCNWSNKQEKKRKDKQKRDFCLWGRRVQLVAFTAVDLLFMRNAAVAGFGTDV